MSKDIEPGGHKILNVGNHSVQIMNQNGELHINIRDHADIVVEGDHKDNPTVHVVDEEFPTEFARHGEGWVWERYYE
jgi:hypothetical protein